MPSLVIVNCIGRVIAFVDGRGATHSISASQNAETRAAPGFPRSPMPGLGAATDSLSEEAWDEMARRAANCPYHNPDCTKCNPPHNLSAAEVPAATRTAPGPINQINKTLDALAEKPGAVNAREGA